MYVRSGEKTLSGFFYLTCLETFDADAHPLWDTVYERAYRLQIREESTRVDTGYLQADAAFFLG